MARNKINRNRNNKDIDKFLILMFMLTTTYLLETNYFSINALKFIIFITYLYFSLKNL